MAAGVRVARAPGAFELFNPCTGEAVAVAGTFHYLLYRDGDLTHTSSGRGIGVESGHEYVYLRRGVETSTAGFFEVVHLLAVGDGTDLTTHDDLGDAEEPIITCT